MTYHQDGLAAVVPQQPVTGPVTRCAVAAKLSPPGGAARGRLARLPRLLASVAGFLPG